jgi:hypothetical protein
VLVPDQIDPNGEFAWLLYEGRWGERQPGSFNGPLGAGVSTRWNDPWVATDNWRQFSIVVPEPNLALGPTMTDTFCTLVGAGSQVLIYSFVFPWAVIPALVIVVLIFAFFIRRSGDLLRRAWQLYRQHWRVFIGIGLLAVPIGIAFNLAQAFLINRDPLRFLVQWFDNTAGASLSAVTAVGSIQQIAMLLLIAPAVIQAVADIQRGQTPGVVRSYRLAATRAVPIGVAALFMLVFAGVPLLTIIGVPISIWLLVRWQFFAQVLVFETERTSRESLHESARLVRRRWWQTLFAVVIFDLIATVPGIIVGFGLLTLGRTAVGFANGVSSLLYSLLIPLSVIGVTLMYLDRRTVPVHVPSAVSPPEPGP